MFSYRHAFHAANHADVLKHTIFLHTLAYYNRKETPYWVIDTHAGAGYYDLRSEWAVKKGEFADGLDRLLAQTQHPAMVDAYLRAVQSFNQDGIANYYPGSPWLALHMLRPQDRLRLFEMHPTEFDVLRGNLQRLDKQSQRQTMLYASDGFDGLKSQLPPAPRRAITIIDPSYEDKRDYWRVLNTVEDGLKRFPTGCYLVWYPIVARREVQNLTRVLEKLPRDWVHGSLTVSKPAADGFGLHGSGMFVINPPWTLHDELEKTLPWLAQVLKQDDHAGFKLTRRVT